MYCFVGDLLGFKNIISNLPLTDQDIRVNQWIDLVTSTANTCQLEDFSLISDTVVVIASEDKEGIKKLIELSKILLEKSITLKLPIRGAISIGEIKRSNLIFFGKALIDAHQFASDQNWIGVSVLPPINQIDHCWDIERLIVYLTPLKNKGTRLYPVVSWKVPKVGDLFKLTTGEGLTRANEILGWEYMDKIQNTAIFAVYIKVIKKLEKDTGKKINIREFHGISPLQIIEMVIEGVPIGIS